MSTTRTHTRAATVGRANAGLPNLPQNPKPMPPANPLQDANPNDPRDDGNGDPNPNPDPNNPNKDQTPSNKDPTVMFMKAINKLSNCESGSQPRC